MGSFYEPVNLGQGFIQINCIKGLQSHEEVIKALIKQHLVSSQQEYVKILPNYIHWCSRGVKKFVQILFWCILKTSNLILH